MATPERLFEVPRIVVLVDESDPDILKIAFTGSVELDRSNPQQVALYNSLREGEATEVVVSAHVAGVRKLHRLDSEGDVAAIVAVKALQVVDVYPVGA